MSTAIIICLIIAASAVYILDYVSFPRNFLARIYSIIFKYEIYPDQVKLPYLLLCSLCFTTWVTLIVLLLLNWKLAPLCLIFGWSTTYILQIMTVIDLALNTLIGNIYKIIEKLKIK